MKSWSPVRLGLVASVVLMGLFSAGLARSNGEPAPSSDISRKNTVNTSMASRTPGKMVNAGMAKLQDVTAPPPATITATAEPGPFDLFMAGLVDMFFTTLQSILTSFADLFLERIGLPPTNTNDNTNTNTNDNTNSNDNTNDNTNANDNTNSNANDNVNTNVNANVNTNANDNTTRPGGIRKTGR